MNNKLKYIVIPCILVISILFLAAYGTKITFGGAWFKDSLSNGIVPNKSIRMQPGDSIYYNGVAVTSGTGGGGISGSDNITFSGVNTFTHKNTFSDTLKADGLSLIDNAKITSNLAVTGDVTTNLGFLKGSSTSIGTISTDSLAIITNNTKRIIIDKNGYTNFTDTVSFSDVVIPNSGIVFPTVSSFLFWNSYSSKISEGINSLNYSAKTHNFLTKNGNNNTAVLDSANGLNLAYGVFTGNGSGLTSVDAITLKGQDTTKFARLDTLTTETNKAKNIFTDLATFITGIFNGLLTVNGDIKTRGVYSSAVYPIAMIGSGTMDSASIPMDSAMIFTDTLSGNMTYIFNTSTVGKTVQVIISNNATSYTVTWPSGILWQGGIAPTQSSSASGVKSDSYFFTKINSTQYLGSYAQNYY